MASATFITATETCEAHRGKWPAHVTERVPSGPHLPISSPVISALLVVIGGNGTGSGHSPESSGPWKSGLPRKPTHHTARAPYMGAEEVWVALGLSRRHGAS